MRLLKFMIKGLRLYKDNCVSMDLYASDRVSAQSASVFRFSGVGKSVCSQRLIGIAGLNASGKTTTLRALSMVLDIVRGAGLDADHLIYGPLTSILNGDFTVKAILEHEGRWYLLESSLAIEREHDVANDGDPLTSGNAFRFTAERLWKHDAKVLHKNELASYDAFRSHSELISTRNVEGSDHELSEDSKRYLPVNTSLISGELKCGKKTVPSRVPVFYYVDSFRMPFVTPSAPPAVVKTFDSNVEQLEVDDDGKVHLKFANDNAERVLGQFDATQLLSVGTVRGSRIVNSAISALCSGGYFLIDEIENSLNKKLVEMIMDLFASPKTNPNGALLVFTTHYPELLDHLERKDNVYFTLRDNEWNIGLVKYADRIFRVEPKKSEIFFSNLVKGTAPKAKDLFALREYVKTKVSVGDADA